MERGRGSGTAKTVPTRFRRLIASVRGSSTLLPSMVTLPSSVTLSSKSIIRLTSEMRVDLPLPDGPMKPVTLFRQTWRLMSRNTAALPNDTLTCSKCILQSMGAVMSTLRLCGA